MTKIKRGLTRWGFMLMLPTLAVAQPLQNQQADPARQEEAVATQADPAKQAAIRALLSAIDADKLVGAIAASARLQARQLVPAILSNALAENKKLSDAQKRALVPPLQQQAVSKLALAAGRVFETEQFHTAAIAAQYKAYADHYTTEEITALTKFYLSPAGRKFVQVQDQVAHDVVSGLLQKYMPQSIRDTRAQADKEVALAARTDKSANKKEKTKQ